MRLSFAVLLLATSVWCACDSDQPRTPVSPTPTPPTTPVSPAPGIVRGTVLDFQTAMPLPGAVVGFATSRTPDGGFTGITETSVSGADGRYSLPEPPAGPQYLFVVNGNLVGMGYPRSTNYRADIAVDRGRCVSRYGTIMDSKTYQPVSGATGWGGVTGADGWYQIDWGCGEGHVGFNTTLLRIEHPNYVTGDFILGRGVAGTNRLDLLLTPR